MSDPTNPNDKSANASVDVIAELKKSNDTLMSQLNNMKAELNRKITNVETRLPAQKAAPVEEDESVEDLLYSNPKKAIEIIENRVSKRVDTKLDANTRNAQVIGDLIYDYPELQDKSSDLFKAAVSMYQGMSPEEQSSPLAYKLAVKTAASDLDVKPRGKRAASDDFSMSGSGGSGNSRGRDRQRNDQLSDETLIFAQKVGFDINDPKIVEKIQARAKRTNWNRYE